MSTKGLQTEHYDDLLLTTDILTELDKWVPRDKPFVPDLNKIPDDFLPQLLAALVYTRRVDTWQQADLCAEMRRRWALSDPNRYEQNTAFVASEDWRERIADLSELYPPGKRSPALSISHYYEIRNMPPALRDEAVKLIREKSLGVREARELRDRLLIGAGLKEESDKHDIIQVTVITSSPEAVEEAMERARSEVLPGEVYEWKIQAKRRKTIQT